MSDRITVSRQLWDELRSKANELEAENNLFRATLQEISGRMGCAIHDSVNLLAAVECAQWTLRGDV